MDADGFAMPGAIAPNAIVESLMNFRLVAIGTPSENELWFNCFTLNAYTQEVNARFASILGGICVYIRIALGPLHNPS